MHSETVSERPLSHLGIPAVQRDILMLVLLWSREEPARVGEAIPAPAPGRGTTWVLGRGDQPLGPPSAALRLYRQRPGQMEPTGPIRSSRISRAQLEVSSRGDQALMVRNIGRCRLLHNGRETDAAELVPGDVLELRNELLFLCTRRPALFPTIPAELEVERHPFGEPDRYGLVGESTALWDLRRQIAFVAGRPHHALILGASGTGKELVARAVHACSSRTQRPLVARNAATIPETLIDAELFGNMKNYPNPGMPERPGLFGEANGSTLFLDEFAELPPSAQGHLLRVMDQGEYQRLGESTLRCSDFRLVGATNRTLEALKHDVLARFKARIQIPDLNDRREDIPLLIRHLLFQAAQTDPFVSERFIREVDGHRDARLMPELLRVLVQHRYVGNIRELEALILRAMRDSTGQYLELTTTLARELESRAPVVPATIDAAAFDAAELQRLSMLRGHGFHASACGQDPAYPGNRQTADLHLRQLLCKALSATRWNAPEAARLLAGQDVDHQARLLRRVETFVKTLQERIEEASAEGVAGAEALTRSLQSEYRDYGVYAVKLLEAVRGGRFEAGPLPGAEDLSPSARHLRG